MASLWGRTDRTARKAEDAANAVAAGSDQPDVAYRKWRGSEQRTNAKRSRQIEEVTAVALAATAVVLGATAVPRSPGGSYRVHAVPLVAAGLLAVTSAGLAVFLWWRYASIKRSYLEDERRELIYKAIELIKPDEVKELITLNQRRMDQYHQMTLSQAAVAWRSSQVAMTAGLVVLVAGVVAALTASSRGTSQLVIGALAGVGSAFSGYIAATFLAARRQSLSQLNHYFRQPLTTSYLLTAERLVAKSGPAEDARQQTWSALATQIVAHAFDPPPAGETTPPSATGT